MSGRTLCFRKVAVEELLRKQAFAAILVAGLLSSVITPSIATAAQPAAQQSKLSTTLQTSSATKLPATADKPVSAIISAKKKSKSKLIATGSVTSKVQDRNSKVTIKGKLNHSRSKGYIVKLQRWSYGTWKTVQTKRVKGKNFTFTNVSLWPQDTWFQLVTPSQGNYKGHSGKNMLVRVARCSTVATPAQVKVAFTKGTEGYSYKPSAITQTFMDGICAAAKNSSIYITMYYSVFGKLTSSSTGAGSVETAYIQRALTYVKDKRKVKIGFLAESRQYPKTKKIAEENEKKNGYGINWNQVVQTKKVFSQLTKNGYGTTYCQAGCRNTDDNSPGNLHSKYVVISKTNWKGNGPAVLNGSANFSAQQLRRTVNDLTQIYNNNAVYKAFVNDWKVNRRCAKALTKKKYKDCASSNGLYSVVANSTKQRWTNTYGLQQLTSDPARRWNATTGMPNGFPGDTNRGIISFFSPVPSYKDYDYVTNVIRQQRCTASRNSIKILIGAFGTQQRTGYFFTELKRLAQTGCKIRIVMSGPTVKTKIKNNKSDNKTPSSSASIALLKKVIKTNYSANGGYVQVRCTQAQHSKNFVFKTQRRLGPPSATESDNSYRFQDFDGTLAGSPNMSAGLLWGTESAELMSVQDATSTADKQSISKAVTAYSKHFDDVWTTKTTAKCKWQ